MKTYFITETATYKVEAEDAQAALDLFLNSGPGEFPMSIDDREVADALGDYCEVEDS